MPNEILHIVSDLDKTLLNDEGVISPQNLESLKLLKKKKITTTIATGRSFNSYKQVKNLFVDYLIFSTGIGIFDFSQNKLIHKTSIDKFQIGKILFILKEYNLDFMIHSAVPNDHNFFYQLGANNDDFIRRLNIKKKFATLLEKNTIIEEAGRVVIITENYEFYQKLSFIFNRLTVILATSPIDHKTLWIEILPLKTNKGESLKKLSKVINIPLENTFCIGNDYNDLDMLKVAKFSYLVENAPAELRSKFLKAPSNNDDGFTKALIDAKII